MSLPITQGQAFKGRMTFQHKGPGEKVYLVFRLDVDAPSPGKWEHALSPWVSLGDDANWTTYTIETSDGVFEWAGGVTGAGWNIAGDIFLRTQLPDGIYAVRLAKWEITNLYYTVLPVALYQEPYAEVM